MLRSVFGPRSRESELRVYLDTEPRQRVFAWEFCAGDVEDEDFVDFIGGPGPIEDVLGRFFDAPREQVRRICGPLEEAEIADLPGAPRITIDSSN